MKKTFILSIFLFTFMSQVSAQSQCQAAFSFVFGGGGFSVTITDESTATAPDVVSAWSWTVDGTPWATTQNLFLPQVISSEVCLTITTNNGCESTTCQTVTNSDPCETFTVDIYVNDETRLGGDGSIEASPWGGTFPFSYNWSGGASTNIISNLPAGSYSVTITDASDCEIIHTATVLLDTTCYLSAAPSIAFPEICGEDGYIEMQSWDGYGDISYAWSNGATTQDAYDLVEGEYEVTVTDETGCVLVVGPINISRQITASGQINSCHIPFDSAFVTNAVSISSVAMNLTWDCYKDGTLYVYVTEYPLGDCLECFIPEVHFLCQSPLITDYFISPDTICRDVTGLFELDEKAIEVNIYPNPTSGNIIIEADNIQKITLLDIQGKVILTSIRKGNNLTVDLGQYSKGIYFIKVNTNEGVAVEKILIE